MKAKESSSMDFVATLSAAVACIAWSAFWLGLAFSFLWALFITPFFGIEKIGIVQAYGLMLVLRVSLAETSKVNGDKRQPSQNTVRCFVLTPFVAGFYILVGWVLAACL